MTGGDGRAVARYVVRGGRENLGRWWQESVDLSALYARAWPGDSTILPPNIPPNLG